MLCYFHSWISLSHSVLLLPSSIWHVSCEVRVGWAGCSGWEEHREQRVEQCCSLRWGVELFPHLSKTGFRPWAGYFRRKYWVSSGLQDLEGWESNFMGRPSPFEVREVAMLREERQVKSFCWHLWKEGTWLPCLCRHHGNVSMATLLPCSLNWAPGTLRVGDREWNHLCAQKKGKTKLCRRQMRRKDAWRALLPSEGKSVLEICFSGSFRSLAELGWQRPSVPLSLKNNKNPTIFTSWPNLNGGQGPGI